MNIKDPDNNWLFAALDPEKIDTKAAVSDLNTIRREIKTVRRMLLCLSDMLHWGLLLIRDLQDCGPAIDEEGGGCLITFTTYIFNQRNREDPVGDLARKAWTDPHFPKMAQPDAVERYLEETGESSTMMQALQQASAEYYKKEVKRGRWAPVR